MEQQNFSSQNQTSPKGIKPFWLIILLVLVIALIGVSVWQKSVTNRTVESLQQQTILLQNQLFQKNNQTSEGVSCVKEGEYLVADLLPKEVDCCSGLSKVDSRFTVENNLAYPAGCVDNVGKKVCTICGNGVCGKGENQCNCPTDCKSATTSNETANWKTYQSDAMGFSMKYPNNWNAGLEANESGGKRVFFEENDAINPASFYLELVVKRGVSYYKGSKKLSCSDRLSNYVERKQITLSGVSALFGAFLDTGNSEKLPTKVYLVCQDNTNTEIYFTVNGYSSAQESIYLSVLNNLIASFKIQK